MSETVTGESTAGARLRAARESAGWSVEEVALKLKLSTRQVTAIEAENWDALPERTFTRGFFRSYARLVGIEERLVDVSFSRPTTAPELLPIAEKSIGEVTMSNTTARSTISRWMIPLALFACLCAGVAWMLWHDTPMPQATSKLPLDVAATASKQASEKSDANTSQLPQYSPNGNVAEAQKKLLLTSDSVAQNANKTGAIPTEANTVTAGSLLLPPTTAAANVIAPSAAPPATATATIAAAPAAVATPITPAANSNITLTAGQKRVNLVVKGRSWAEVRSRGDTVISEMLNDTTREIASRGPISFVLGNASNVTLTIDGKPYDFSMHVRNEVARFRVE